jgi:hypothetical protein
MGITTGSNQGTRDPAGEERPGRGEAEMRGRRSVGFSRPVAYTQFLNQMIRRTTVRQSKDDA